MSDLIHVPQHRYRRAIPKAHKQSLDTRVHWLWHQKFGTVQTIWKISQEEGEVLDHTACTLVLQAIMAKDLDAISQLFQRIEGGSRIDTELLDDPEPVRI